MLIRCLYLFAILCAGGFSLRLEAQQYYFANYSVDDGLPHSQVNHVLQADDGYLWIATNMGVSRFDGHEFRSYSAKDGMGDNKVRVIFQPSPGSLLFGHENGTLSWWDGKRFEVLQLRPETRRILCIYKDLSDDVWIGTEGAGVFRLKGEDLLKNLRRAAYVQYNYSSGLSRDVLGVARIRNGPCLFITDLGLKQMDKNSGRFSFYKPNGLDVVQFSSILVDGKDNIWLGTVKEGLYRYAHGRSGFTRYDTVSGELGSNFVTCLKLNRRGEVMAGTWGGGLSVIGEGRVIRLAEENGLGENKIRCVMEDSEGNIWAGTNQNGLSCFRGGGFEVYFRSRGGTNTQIGAVYGDSRGRMWFGANSRIMLVRQAGARAETIELGYSGRDAEVTSINEDRRGRIWVSTWGGGVFLLDPATLEVSRFTGRIPASSDITFNENFIYSMYPDRKGRIWFSMLQGLSVFDPAENSIKTYTRREGLPENSITALQEDRLGRLWIGTSGRGLCIFDGRRFTPVRPADIRINPSISSLAMDPSGKIWVATEGGGVYCFDGRKYSNFTIADGLPSNYVSFIEADRNGGIWLGTHKGVCLYLPGQKNGIVFDKTDKHARIEAKPNAAFLDSRGDIWAGTINGVLKINTAKVALNRKEAVTYITAVKVYQDTLRSEGIRLNFRRNYLSFFFKGLCFSDPDKVLYQYKLEGADKDWQTVSQNYATYNNLSPGKYVFMVRSSNNHGVWNPVPVTYRFEITPPFWMTWWFYTGSALLLIVLVFVFVKFRERNLRLEKRHLEQMVDARTREIVRQKEEIESQRDELKESSSIIEQKNLAITDSIRYA
jgi:ligand-binding sensor domain-containing protein